MIWLSNSTIARLRDQLRTRGQRPSVAIGDGKLTPDAAELLQVVAEYGPICEAMYLMMSADGKITSDEREVLKGALRHPLGPHRGHAGRVGEESRRGGARRAAT
jgi:hypothetical protein